MLSWLQVEDFIHNNNTGGSLHRKGLCYVNVWLSPVNRKHQITYTFLWRNPTVIMSELLFLDYDINSKLVIVKNRCMKN